MGWVKHHRAFGRLALSLGTIGVLLATMTSLAAAASSTCEQRAMRAHQALFGGSLDNWEPVNDRTVLVWTRHSQRAHLVKLKSPLQGLKAASTIILVDGDHDGRVSPCGHDGITLGDAGGGEHVAEIFSIELLSERRTVQLDPGEHMAPTRLISA